MYIHPRPYKCRVCGFECDYSPHISPPTPKGLVACPRCWEEWIQKNIGCMEPKTEAPQDPSVPEPPAQMLVHDLKYRDDGLAHCPVCGGAEGALPTDCPGHRMKLSDLIHVHTGKLDFREGAWVNLKESEHV